MSVFLTGFLYVKTFAGLFGQLQGRISILVQRVEVNVVLQATVEALGVTSQAARVCQIIS